MRWDIPNYLLSEKSLVQITVRSLFLTREQSLG